jgi:hypothetical protein
MTAIMISFVILLTVLLIGLSKGNNITNDSSLDQNVTMVIELNEGQEDLLADLPIVISENIIFPIRVRLPVKAVMDNFVKRRSANRNATRYNNKRNNRNKRNKNTVNNMAPKSAPIIPTQPTTNKNTVTKPQKKDVRAVKRTNLRNGYVSKPNKNAKTSSRNLRGTPDKNNNSVYNPPNRYCYIMLRSIKALVECKK